ncbi:G-box-binding factor 3-like [Asparagus officinalis]|uniref:G-box-binding factor 3-like n=1 Tax=Asparagus officinalis TaxID=4686 RepID=UPI00098E8084|nr:G-box-binding factor 3-like [Asparagus officinalis]XP_020264974.1 G-box-binding factor 3-like [Asparagus officinalis]
MGNDEAVAPSKAVKASSPVQEQPVVHPYPDWAAMQAYYGPGVPMPPPYFNGTVATGHPPHPYMWGPQPLMPPYATPYAAMYPHGLYSHPSAGLMVSPSSTDVPSKSSNNKDVGLMKKLKGFDGLAVSIGNVSAEIAAGDGSGQSQSGDNGPEGSSDASDENNESGGKENRKKRSSDGTPTSGDKKVCALANTIHSVAAPEMAVGVVMSPSPITCKPMCTLPALSQAPGMELKASATSQLKAGVNPEQWTQDERELKRERRKQSNRESARRSRLRKQAETEELATKVESLGAENVSLRSEISQLKENSEKLRAENSSLMEKLKNVQDVSSDELENQETPTIVVENFLSRIDELRQDENHENSNGGKLHQLMDSNPRTDAVAAG